MAFKMKGSSLYGKLNLNRGGNENRPDGRAKSSAFQKDESPKPTPSPKPVKAPKQPGPPFLGAVMGAVGKVKGVVDKVKKVKGTIDKVKDVASKIPGFKKHGEPEKSGAPMTDKPKHQKGGSYTYKGKTYPDFAHLPDAAKQQIYAKNAPNQELAKKVYGIKDENRDKEVAKKPGAPAIWPFKKKTPGGAKLVKVKKTKTTEPSQDLEGDTMQTYLDKTKGKRKRRKVEKNITKKVKNIFKKK